MTELLASLETRRVIFLGYFGFSNACIRQRSGLTDSQIYHILRRAGVTRKMYRDGDAMSAKVVLGEVFLNHRVQKHRWERSLRRVMLKAK